MQNIAEKELETGISSGLPSIVSSGYLFKPLKPKEENMESVRSLLTSSSDVELSTLKEFGKVRPYIVMPKYEKTLLNYFVENKKMKLSDIDILLVTYQVLSQLEFVH